MANFEVHNLILVRPCPITEQTRDMAVHAQSILDNAQVVDDFAKVTERMDWLVAFSARTFATDTTQTRVPVEPSAVAAQLWQLSGNVALVFGREDNGLSNEEISACDVVCTIPTSGQYKSLNLSHAAAVALYAICSARFDWQKPRAASAVERRVMAAHLSAILEGIGMPEHRKRITLMTWKRILGRAALSEWEYHRIMGIFSPILKGRGKWPARGFGQRKSAGPPVVPRGAARPNRKRARGQIHPRGSPPKAAGKPRGNRRNGQSERPRRGSRRSRP
jgi:TrmH family RNA methyltransferase